jgi:hypothetical protein
MDDQYSFEPDNVEYLDIDDFLALGMSALNVLLHVKIVFTVLVEDETFNEFCSSLQYDPFHPDRYYCSCVCFVVSYCFFSENQAILDIIGKRKRLEENQDDTNSSSSFSQVDISQPTTAFSSFETQMKSESEKIDNIPKKKLRKNARNDPIEVRPPQAQVPKDHSQQLPPNEEIAQSTATLLPKYRLPLSDIRRSYSSFFISAMNSTDPVVLEDFFRKYCSSNFMMLLKYVGPTTAAYFGDHVEVVGLETNIQVFPTILASFPDLIMKVLDNKIRVIKNGYCSSISKYLFWGTKIFQLPMDNDYQSLIYNDLPTSSSAFSSSLTPSVTSSLPSSSVSSSIAASHSSSFILPNLPSCSSPLTSSDRLTAISVSDKSYSESLGSLEDMDTNDSDNNGPNPNNVNVNDSNNNFNNNDINGNKLINIVCAKIPKSSVCSSEFTLKKHLKNLCLSKRYDDLAKPLSDHPTISLDNIITTSSFTAGNAIPDPQRFIIVGTVNILINPDKQIYKIEFIHSLKQ